MLKNIIINSIGIATIASLFMLPAFLMIAPETYSENTMAVSKSEDMDGSITILSAISMTATPTVMIDLAPTAADADFKIASTDITIATNNVTGYTLQFSDEDSDTSLQYAAEELNKIHYGDMEVEIPSITSDITASINSHDDFLTNTWGYSLDGATWMSIPSIYNTTTINSTNQQSTESTTSISFAAKADMNLLGGYYQDTLRVTAVTNWDPSLYSELNSTPDPDCTDDEHCTDNGNDDDGSGSGSGSGGVTTTIGQGGGTPVPPTTDIAESGNYNPCPGYDVEDYAKGSSCPTISSITKQNLQEWTVSSDSQLNTGIRIENYSGSGKRIVTFLQDMTKQVCQNVSTPAARVNGEINTNVPKIVLIDYRDWNRYTVVKLADGNCWMQGTLRLHQEAITQRNARWLNAEVSYSRKGDAVTQLDSSNTDIRDDTVINVSSLPNTALINGTTVTGWESSFTKSQIAYVGEAATAANHNHFLYNWHAATATPEDDSVKNIDWSKLDHDGDPIQRNSLCPKGWRMPNENWNRSYKKLIRGIYEFIPNDQGYNVDQANISVKKFKILRKKPFRFIYTGHIAGNNSTTLAHGNDRGLFWSRVTDNDDYASEHGNAYSMMIDNSESDQLVDVKHTSDKRGGLAVRCLFNASSN